jgi:hypothetical protein
MLCAGARSALVHQSERWRTVAGLQDAPSDRRPAKGGGLRRSAGCTGFCARAAIVGLSASTRRPAARARMGERYAAERPSSGAANTGSSDASVRHRMRQMPALSSGGSRAGPRLVAASINRQQRGHGRSRGRRVAERLQWSPIWLATDGSRGILSILDERIASGAACARSARSAWSEAESDNADDKLGARGGSPIERPSRHPTSRGGNLTRVRNRLPPCL